MSGGPASVGAGAVDDGAAWQHPALRELAGGAVRLPVEATARGQRDQHLILLRLIVAFVVILGVLLAVVLATAGMLPQLGFGDGPSTPANLDRMLTVVVYLPLGLGLLLYLFLYFAFVRRRADEGDHPWGYRVTAEDFTVMRRDGAPLRGPWRHWRYEGSLCSVVRLRTVVWGVDLSLDGQRVLIDLRRTRNSRALIRAVLQLMAAHGNTDGGTDRGTARGAE